MAGNPSFVARSAEPVHRSWSLMTWLYCDFFSIQFLLVVKQRDGIDCTLSLIVSLLNERRHVVFISCLRNTIRSQSMTWSLQISTQSVSLCITFSCCRRHQKCIEYYMSQWLSAKWCILAHPVQSPSVTFQRLNAYISHSTCLTPSFNTILTLPGSDRLIDLQLCQRDGYLFIFFAFRCHFVRSVNLPTTNIWYSILVP